MRKLGLSFMIRVIGRENLFRYSTGKDYCVIKGCSNTDGQIGRFGKAVKLHPLSKSYLKRAAWLRAINRENFKPAKCIQLCNDNFSGGISRNWKYTVPVIHLRQNKNMQDVSRQIRNSQCTNNNDILYWTDRSEDACHSQIRLFTRKIRFEINIISITATRQL